MNVTGMPAMPGCGATVKPAFGSKLPGMSAVTTAGALRWSYWSRVQTAKHQ